MARIFSISFSYNSTICHAMIFVKTTPFYTEYNVTLHEDEVADALPCTRIVSSAPGQYAYLNTDTATYTPLMHEVLKAVQSHLQSEPVSNERE